MRHPQRLAFVLSLLVLAACAGSAQQPDTPATPPAETQAESGGYVLSGDVTTRPPVHTDAPHSAPPKNVILFISDGTGPASFTLARRVRTELLGQPEGLALDAILTGSAETSASNARVTDSAAGATALSAGVKTYNGAIGVDADGLPVGTLLEAAEAKGMVTGLVATSRITHATPASFAAHVPRRSMESEIAEQMLTQGIEVLIGGGQGNFVPEAEGGRRRDARNLFAEAADAGALVLTDPADFGTTALRTPLLAVFNGSHLAYEIDRETTDEPSLAAMTQAAIDLLSPSDTGFFLMVEGSRIDHAAHGNDAAAHLHDILAYDDAVRTALAFAEADGETLVVSTSDHETGGLTLGRNRDGRGIYDYLPDTLMQVQRSMEWVAARAAEQGDALDTDALLREMGLAIFTQAERDTLAARLRSGPRDFYPAYTAMLSERTLLGWTTGGHTAVDVPVFASGPGADRFVGHFPNTHISTTIADLLGLDLDAITAKLRAE